MNKKLSVLKIIGLLVVIIILLKIGFWPIRIEGHSMEPTLDHNDVVVLSKVPLWLNQLDYGDFVIVDLEEGEDPSQHIVKRLIGKAGDHIVIKEGVLYVNGQLVEEPYVQGIMTQTLDYYVPINQYFILGDNRTVSKDSRYFGCIDEKMITEKVLFKLF